jgi:general stress protein 26
MGMEDKRTDVARLLAGAARTITSVRSSWLVTLTETGTPNARPMGRLPRDLDEDEWTIRFLTDARSRKASEIRRAGNATVIFQDAEDAFVALGGSAALREEAPEVNRRWKSAYNVYFPTEQDRANAAFIEIAPQCMELWIRGVTSEPVGLYPRRLVRAARGRWQMVASNPDALSPISRATPQALHPRPSSDSEYGDHRLFRPCAEIVG